MELYDAYIPEKAKSGYLFHLFTVRPIPGKRPFREHRHSQFEIGFFIKGTGVYSIAGQQYSIHAGDIFIFSSNEVHCITQVDSEIEMELMNIHFEPRYLWVSEDDPFLKDNSGFFFSHNDEFKNRLLRDNHETETIKQLILEIESELTERKEAYLSMVRSKLIHILVSLIRNYNYYQKNNASDNYNYIVSAIDYIRDNCTGSITLQSIAEAVNISPNYLSTIFHQTTGVPIWDYVTENRINSAMHLLDVHSSKTMLEIALLCGFNNTANFNRAFKKYTGLSPSEYKNYGISTLY
jgi:YesN/AraC family two-component response regulator